MTKTEKSILGLIVIIVVALFIMVGSISYTINKHGGAKAVLTELVIEVKEIARAERVEVDAE